MDDHWRWADPEGQQRRVRTGRTARGALLGTHRAQRAPVWRSGWSRVATGQRSARAHDERARLGKRRRTKHSAAAVGDGRGPARVRTRIRSRRRSPDGIEPPPPPHYEPMPTKAVPATPPSAPSSSPILVPPPPAPSSRPQPPPMIAHTPGAMPIDFDWSQTAAADAKRCSVFRRWKCSRRHQARDRRARAHRDPCPLSRRRRRRMVR